MATRIDGKALAAKVKAQTAEAAKSLYRRPGLAVILVGNDPASRVYVTGKEKDCAECGFLSFEHALPEDTTQETLLDLIQELNRDPQVDGILCQLPLPGHLDEEAVLNAIARTRTWISSTPITWDALRSVIRCLCNAPLPASWRCCGNTASPSGAGGAWCWAAAISWASPWPCCCSSRTAP